MTVKGAGQQICETVTAWEEIAHAPHLLAGPNSALVTAKSATYTATASWTSRFQCLCGMNW
jgi:hypothetical protein